VHDGRPLDQGWVAVLDDGRDVPITGLVMLGRSPQARAGEDDAELVKVADDTRTVSKTHLSLKVDASGLFVMDRGSTNGTTLTNVVGVSKPCPAGDIVPVSEGAIVSFGDHWLKIERRFDR
jgi:pSer/pThr/pTyr-binding forkhead associated (FHA) protein